MCLKYNYLVNIYQSEVAQSCPTLCDPMGCSLPSSSVHGIFQAIALEWIAISFSKYIPKKYIHLLYLTINIIKIVQLSSVTQLCPTLCDPVYCSMPGFPVHHPLPEFAQTNVHRVSDAIKPSHPLSSPSPPAFNLSQHQGLFQWVSSSHQVAKVSELQL